MGGSLTGFLRDGAWLTRERVVFYCAMTLVGYALFAAVTLFTTPEVLSGRVYARDFSSLWSAGALAREGRAPAAYDEVALDARERKVFGAATQNHYAFFYPPVFLLAGALLALLPYALAQLLWLAGTAAAYVAVLRRIWPQPATVLVALASPGFLFNLLYGQNGCLSAALLGAGLLLLEARPLAAGALLGALCYKPQVALLVPIALLAGGQWRALVAMGVSGVALCVASALAFGTDTWLAFLHGGAQTRAALEQGAPGFYHMVTVFAAARLAGAAVPLAWLLQGVASAASVAIVALAWRSPRPLALKGAVLVAAIPLATPFALAYDLVIEALAVAWLAREGVSTGFRPWERSVMVAVALIPVAGPLLARPTGIALAPLVGAALLAVLWRRVRATEAVA